MPHVRSSTWLWTIEIARTIADFNCGTTPTKSSQPPLARSGEPPMSGKELLQKELANERTGFASNGSVLADCIVRLQSTDCWESRTTVLNIYQPGWFVGLANPVISDYPYKVDSTPKRFFWESCRGMFG